MSTMKDDLDQILNSHLKRKLDPQRGSAVETFREHVLEAKPPRVTLLSQVRHRHLGRWVAAGVAVAACLLIAFVVSSNQRSHKTDIARDGQPPANKSPQATATTPITYTRVITHTDRGMVMLQENQVGRRVSQREINHYRWTDESGAVYEYFAPTERELVLAVHQQ